jgi:hypothetical protein
MIKATFYKNQNDIITGFSIKGHAGYSEAGSDIVCAAVSALSVNTVNAVESFTGNKFKVEQGDSGFLQFKFLSDPDENGQILLRTLELGLNGISRQYGKKYLQVHYKEV